MTISVYSLSICGQATIDMHSLNNEGGEGNQIQTRMVDIVDDTGRLQTVNAISGDMLKHIQSEHLYRVSKGKLPLSRGAELLNANRITADEEFTSRISGYRPSQVIDDLIQTCAVTDMAGILVTQGNRSVPRKSIAEFGWVVGLPKETVTEQYFHAKYVPESPESSKNKEERKSNLGQNIFYRPASSGIYAVVSHFEIARIGFNDITQTYAIETAQRQQRYQALLESALYTFIQPNGAMRSSQLPHVLGFSGVVSYSTEPIPAPTVSPLNVGADKSNPAYVKQIKDIAEAMNKIRQTEAIVTKPFHNLATLTDIVGDLITNGQPYQI